MDSFQKPLDFIFTHYTPGRRDVSEHLFGKKESHIVIEVKNKDDLRALLAALENTKFVSKNHFMVRGLEVIFTKRGEYKFLNNQKEHAVASNPRWLEYANLCAVQSQEVTRYYPHGTHVEVHPVHGYAAISPFDNHASIDTEPKAELIAKFHLSVDESQVAQAWDAIAPYLIDHHIPCKVATPTLLNRQKKPQDLQGKTIVLYTTPQNIRDAGEWRQTLEAVETLLIANNIKPGPTVRTDRPIEGSRYFHLHYGHTVYDEATGKGTPWDSDLKALNGGIDPLRDLTVHVTEQQAKRFESQATSTTANAIITRP
jgi:hypothetical protein